MPAIRPARVALVTGAARRIGAAIAQTLHAAGYDLALHYRHSRADVDVLAGSLESARRDSTLALAADLADPAQLPGLVEATIARFGRLDALVNNASVFYPTSVGSITAQQWDDVFAANARAPLLLAQAAAPHLKVSRGAIVNITDIHGLQPLPRHSVYCMSKAALVMATRALAQDLAPEVRVNAVAPGAILWPEAGKNEAARARLLARIPLARMGAPADIADAVLWLLRDAGYVTGQTLRIDGGRSLDA